MRAAVNRLANWIPRTAHYTAPMKPYRTIPILECGEPMAVIPAQIFRLTEPHPYIALGAPYGQASPWMLREGVLLALTRAQTALENKQPGWKLKIFDAYRPNAVQAFMAEWEFRQHSGGRPSASVAEPERALIYEKVWRIWGLPSDDPASPPVHSTGGAVDLTIADISGRDIDMGSPIDENSDRSDPDYFEVRDTAIHARRTLLREIMQNEGFRQHPREWWHFSLGDQIWAWEERQNTPGSQAVARYGRVDLL